MAKLNGVKTIDMVNGEITKVSYNGVEYVKVDGLVKSTEDILLAIENGLDRTKGEFYRVIGVGSTVRWEDTTSANGVGAEYISDRFEVFRKISDDKPTLEQRVETIEQAQAQLVSDVTALKGEKVAEAPKRLTTGDVAKVISRDSKYKGEVGDVVKIVVDDKSKWPYRCKRISDGVALGWFYESALEAYVEETIEFEGATYRKVDREAREGDVVVLTGDELPCWFTKDKAYKIGKGPYIEKCDKGYKNYVVYDFSYGRTRETVDVYEAIAKAKTPKLKAGNFVKFKKDTPSITSEKPYEISVDEDGELYFIDNDGDHRWEPLRVHEYEILSAEEVKWAKIGRKPNEFKVGDIVEVTGSTGGHSVGTIGEVVKAPPHFIGTNIGVKANGHIKSHLGQMKLVAPVESLFNANA